jgi:hypothetical protein
VAFGLEMTYHRLDGGASSQLAFNDAEDAALCPEIKMRRGFSVS